MSDYGSCLSTSARMTGSYRVHEKWLQRQPRLIYDSYVDIIGTEQYCFADDCWRVIVKRTNRMNTKVDVDEEETTSSKQRYIDHIICGSGSSRYYSMPVQLHAEEKVGLYIYPYVSNSIQMVHSVPSRFISSGSVTSRPSCADNSVPYGNAHWLRRMCRYHVRIILSVYFNLRSTDDEFTMLSYQFDALLVSLMLSRDKVRLRSFVIALRKAYIYAVTREGYDWCRYAGLFMSEQNVVKTNNRLCLS